MIYLPIPREMLSMLRDFGWRVDEIAEEIGVSKASISRIATGRSRPSRETALAIMNLAEREAKKVRGIKEVLDTYYKEHRA